MYESSDSLEGNWLTKNSVTKQSNAGCATERNKFKTGLIVCATIFDVLIVFGIATIEYYFRWTNVFPVRQKSTQEFCIKAGPTYSYIDSELTDFWQKAEIPEIAVYIYSFSFPIVIVLIGEVLVFVLANQSTKLLPGGSCSPLHIPHTIRRLYRFSLSFLFGILCLMVIVDSIKIMVGELRPGVWKICHHNLSNASTVSDNERMDFWKDQQPQVVRKLRTSCPSMRSAISMYAGLFTTTYLHGIGLIHHSKYLLIPLLNMAQILSSILYGIILVVQREAWWTDVIIGHLLGAVVALYLTFFVLRQFKFQETVSNRRIFRQLALLQNCNRLKENKEMPKILDSCIEPVRLRRAHAPCTSYQCNCVVCPPPVSVRGINTDDTSTFFPVSKPNRKSVTLPISSPHIPMNHQQAGDKTETANHKLCSNEKRLSAVNLSRRHIILSQNMPKISQELMNLLNAKQEPQVPAREYISLNSKDQPETSML